MKRFIVLLVMSVLVVGCATQTAAPTNVPAAAPSPTPSPTTQDAAAPTPAGGLWIQPGVPVDLAEAARAAFSDVPEVDAEAESTVRITLNPTDSPVAAERIFALVGPFATVRDELTWQAFTTYWQTGSGLDEAPTLVMTPATADMLIALLGPTGSAPVQLVEPAALTGTLWDFRPALGVVPFDQLEPAQKALTVDGVSLLEPDADLSGYPLRVTVGASGPGVEGLAWAPTNRDPARISSVVLTGTTAIARATAMQVELNGVGFPAAQIAPFFAGVDILHTSNESSYAVDCPPPDWYG
ncbi:MAG: hypothetical protein GYB64_13845, partial [Chloroflexi bacterium]|nr:hypothetical protein [Chloroflexota bacterium]